MKTKPRFDPKDYGWRSEVLTVKYSTKIRKRRRQRQRSKAARASFTNNTMLLLITLFRRPDRYTAEFDACTRLWVVVVLRRRRQSSDGRTVWRSVGRSVARTDERTVGSVNCTVAPGGTTAPHPRRRQLRHRHLPTDSVISRRDSGGPPWKFFFIVISNVRRYGTRSCYIIVIVNDIIVDCTACGFDEVINNNVVGCRVVRVQCDVIKSWNSIFEIFTNNDRKNVEFEFVLYSFKPFL